jgi:hypothetical protein
MNKGLFDFDRISPDGPNPRFLSVGGGLPHELAGSDAVVDAPGIRGSMRDVQSFSPMVGGSRGKNRRNRKTKRRAKKNKKAKKVRRKTGRS